METFSFSTWKGGNPLSWSGFDACIIILILDGLKKNKKKLAHSFSLCVIVPRLRSFPAGLGDDKRLQGFYSSSTAEDCSRSLPAEASSS